MELPDRALLQSSYHAYSNWTHGVTVVVAFIAEVLHPLTQRLGCAYWLFVAMFVGAFASAIALLWRLIKPERATHILMFCSITGALAGVLFVADKVDDEHGAIAHFIPAVKQLQKPLGKIDTKIVRIESKIDKNDNKAERRHREEMAAHERTQELVLRLLAMNSASAAPLAEQTLGAAIAAAEQGAAAGDARLQQALDLLRANKIAEAEALFRAVAEEKTASINRDRKDGAAAFRNLGAIARFSDPKRALDAYQKALDLDPDDLDSILLVGSLQLDRGELQNAEANFKRILSRASAENDPYHVYWAKLWFGDIKKERFKLTDATENYLGAQQIAERLAKAGPDNAAPPSSAVTPLASNAQSDFILPDSDTRLLSPDDLKGLSGTELRMARNEILARRGRFFASPNLVARFSRYSWYRPNTWDPPLNDIETANFLLLARWPGWQRNLSVSYGRIGDVLVAQGNLPAALKIFRYGLAIADRLAKADPSNAVWQRDLSVSYGRVGDVLLAQDNMPEALKLFRDGMVIADRLAQTDPGNAVWQRDLSVAYERVGDVLVAQDTLPESLKLFRDGLAIREHLSVSYERAGNVLAGVQDRLPEPLKLFRDGLAIADRLAKADPSNAVWQRDLSVSYNKIGDGLVAQGNLPEALKSYRDGLAIRERLAKADPGNAGCQRDLIVSYIKIAEIDRSRASTLLPGAAEVADNMRLNGVLNPSDAWIPGYIAGRIAALPP